MNAQNIRMIHIPCQSRLFRYHNQKSEAGMKKYAVATIASAIWETACIDADHPPHALRGVNGVASNKYMRSNGSIVNLSLRQILARTKRLLAGAGAFVARLALAVGGLDDFGAVAFLTQLSSHRPHAGLFQNDLPCIRPDLPRRQARPPWCSGPLPRSERPLLPR